MKLVVHRKREPFDMYIGRSLVWRNPFEIGVAGNRTDVIRALPRVDQRSARAL